MEAIPTASRPARAGTASRPRTCPSVPAGALRVNPGRPIHPAPATAGPAIDPSNSQPAESGRPFDLLFTDIILPGGMTGRQLADEAALRRPGMKVLYTSGYTDNAIVHQGRLDPGVLLLSKPYRKSKLADMIRRALKAEAAAAAPSHAQ